jgi:flagellar motor switch protein FliM
MHETLARNLSHSLGAYLSAKVEVALVSVEQLAYSEFLSRFPELTYYASFVLRPGSSCGAVQVDLSLAFPMIDLLLGGSGSSQPMAREVSEIEAFLLEGAGQIVCHELQLVWQPVGLQFAFEEHQPATQMIRIMPPQEKALAISFEVSVSGRHGMFNLALPGVASSALLRKVSSELVYQHPPSTTLRESTRTRLLDSTLTVELATPKIAVKLLDVLHLKPGFVLPLSHEIGEPVVLRLGGRHHWFARPVRSSKNRRAAQLVERVVQPEDGDLNDRTQ